MKRKCYGCNSEFSFTQKDVKNKTFEEWEREENTGKGCMEFIFRKHQTTHKTVKCKACGKINKLRQIRSVALGETRVEFYGWSE